MMNATKTEAMELRKVFIPKGSTERRDDQTGAVVYTYEAGSALYALAFHGKAGKPDWHYRFRTEESREQMIAQHFSNWRSKAESKAERQSTRAAFAHRYQIGDILTCSWGYDQTNVDFYQVVALKGKSQVVIREISFRSPAELEGALAAMTGYVTASRDAFIGPEMLKRVQPSTDGGYLTMTSYSSAYMWDGRPRFVSWYA